MYWVTSYSNVYLFKLIIIQFFAIPICKPVVILSPLIYMYFYVSYLLASIQYSHTFYSTANFTYMCNLTVYSCLAILQEYNSH